MLVKSRFLSLNLDFLGKNRLGVPLFKDGTYLKVERPSDHDLAKSLYYPPYGDHITKYIMVCTATPKVCLLIEMIKYVNERN